jgi:hypothetical protein
MSLDPVKDCNRKPDRCSLTSNETEIPLTKTFPLHDKEDDGVYK